LEERTKKREWDEGKVVPDEAVMPMKQNFTAPHVGEGFTSIVKKTYISKKEIVHFVFDFYSVVSCVCAHNFFFLVHQKQFFYATFFYTNHSLSLFV